MLITLSPLDYAIALPFIFLAGMIDAIAGGGGLISLPAYWSIGLPPHIALGTNKFSSCFGTIFSTVNYFRAKMIDIPVALSSAVFALLGSWLGASTALRISPQILNYLLVILIPIVTIVSLSSRKMGFSNRSHLLKIGYRITLGCVAGLVIGFYDGFFGPGTGTFLILIYASLMHYDFIKANGNSKVVNLASNVAALITFAVSGSIFLPIAIPGAICGITGNIIGSKLVILKGNKLIKQVFILALLLLLARIIYNLLSR
ncbi:TSUP family transporter [Candidatus Cloacimonadota bacterium]|nr:TSUP family transporter [Candidatus Cloacimonadota bacterium]